MQITIPNPAGFEFGSAARAARRPGLAGLAVGVCCASILSAILLSAPAQSEPLSIDVFRMPKAQEAQVSLAGLLKSGRFVAARKATKIMLERFPDLAFPHFATAFLAAKEGDADSVLESLEAAMERGFRDADALEKSVVFDPVKSDPRFGALLQKIRAIPAKKPNGTPRPKPAPVQNGVALVSGDNTNWDSRLNLLQADFTFNSKLFASRTVDSGKKSPASALLNDWYRSGRASGNVGDLYDNRDRNHSIVNKKLLPQLSFVEYGAAAKAAGTDFGFNNVLFYNAPTFGNSSVGVKGLYSVARFALANPREAGILYLQYRANQLYIYPSVRDHAPFGVDRFIANTPYMLVSRGKSGSDKPFMRAIANILAAFKPQVKRYLIDNRLLMPTVQMVFRRGQAGVESEADYLSSSTHPTVFDGERIDRERMVKLANSLEIEDIPPLVVLTVKEENLLAGSVAGPNPKGVLFDTPSAVARIVAQDGEEKRLTVGVEKTAGVAKGGVTVSWVVLEGDPSKVKITPIDAKGLTVQITVPWHGRHQSAATPEIDSDRVDIGVFVKKGKYYSAPAFVSVSNMVQDGG